jgi:hypothetical protein
VSCAPSGDEGPTSYIEIEKTKNKLSETKGNNKKTNEQTNKIKININYVGGVCALLIVLHPAVVDVNPAISFAILTFTF